MLNPRQTLLAAMIFVAAASRLIPHPPNMTALTAMALFAGATLARPRYAFLVPLAALVLSDLLIGFYSGMVFVYGAFAATVGIGLLLRQRRRPLAIGAASLAGSALFYLVTNFGVWASSSLYPETGAGLVACYTAGIPFFRNMVEGDLFYAAVLFGSFALLERLVPALKDCVPVKRVPAA
ncbi:MAG: hypothetical protein KGO02_00125 [Alphaproteobacteria bacterium]|nr:hypothetical protein [Alphaproteobacteria bacterium]